MITAFKYFQSSPEIENPNSEIKYVSPCFQ